MKPGENSGSESLITPQAVPLLGDYYEELTKVVKTLWERAKEYLHLEGSGVGSLSGPAGLQL